MAISRKSKQKGKRLGEKNDCPLQRMAVVYEKSSPDPEHSADERVYVEFRGANASTALYWEASKIHEDSKERADYAMSFTGKYRMTFPGWELERIAKLFEKYKPVTQEKL